MSRGRTVGLIVFLCLAWTAIGAILLWPERDGSSDSDPDLVTETVTAAEEEPATPLTTEATTAAPGPVVSSEFALEPAAPPYLVEPMLKRPPRAGVLFDVETGEVLWARRPELEVPIASLTKMMTALVIAEEHGPREKVLVSTKAPKVEGSRIGVLEAGRQVPLRGLFLGLLMVSGNDAAAALAEHDAGTIAAFVAKMNAKAAALGLSCSRFAGPAGLQDNGNASCASDLAALARADLANDWIASVTSRRSASVPFPIKGGKLELANNHYFVQQGIAGAASATVTGVKTGYTNGAGRCYVTTAKLGGTHLGVVLLDSEDPINQVPQLLRAGFVANGALSPPSAPKQPKRN